MTKPNFFIIGFPKCGTTSLAAYLASHPDCFFSPVKEPHYFASDIKSREVRKHKFLAQYTALFEPVEKEKMIGEASTLYVYSKEAIDRIEDYCDNPLYIICLRNPAEMVISEHAQMLKSGHETVDNFYDAWCFSDDRINGNSLPPKVEDRFLVSYKAFGQISKYVDKFLDKVERDRVLFVAFDDLVEDAQKTYLDVLNFLGLEDDGRDNFVKFNARAYHRSHVLAKFVNSPPKRLLVLSEKIKRVTGLKRLGLNSLLRSINLKHEKKKVPSSVKEELNKFFEKEMIYAEQVVKRSLSK